MAGADGNGKHAPRRRRRFLSIVDWPRMAPKHANRNFPWCRFYLAGARESPLNSRQYMALTKSQRADYWHLVMLANQHNNMTPDDPELLKFLLRESDPLDVQALVSAGLVCRRVAGRAAANGRQDAVAGEVRSKDLGEDQGEDQGEGASPAAPRPPGIFIRLKDRPEPAEISGLISKYQGQYVRINVREQLERFAARLAKNPDSAPTLAQLDRSITGWLEQAAAFSSRRSKAGTLGPDDVH